MKHVFDPKEYPYSQRKEDTEYIATPMLLDAIQGAYNPTVTRDKVIQLARNVREAYPELTLEVVTVTVPLTLEVIVEGFRLSESDASNAAWFYASSQLQRSQREVRSYSRILKEETGHTLRRALVYIGRPTTITEPTRSELEAAKEVATIQ